VVDGTTVENNGNVPLSELYPGNLTTNSDGTTTVKYATVGGGDGNSVSYAITETFIWPDGSQQTSSVSFVAPSLTP
jgi:hypothetical protein